MYRSYENPRSLQKQIEEVREKMLVTDPESEEYFSLNETLEDLTERENFAWQDEEAG